MSLLGMDRSYEQSTPRISQRVGGRFVLVVLCLALVACIGLSACAQEKADTQPKLEYKTELMDEGTLKVLVSPDYPPFADGSASDAWGYDIAVAQELADRLDLSLELVATPRDTIISTLACEPLANTSAEEPPDPQGDIAIAALAITGERDEKVDFSDWYYVGDQAVVTRTGAYQSTTEFDTDKTRIAVVKGSTCVDTAKTLTGEELVVEYSTARKCLQALKAKEVQAALLDLPVASYLLDHEFKGMRILEYLMTGEAYGIALPTQSAHLKDAINEALAEMDEDGTLERLEDEYLR